LVNDNESGPDDVGGEDVGSVAEEAAKLFGALSGWAREQGEGMGHGVGHGVAGAAHGISDFTQNVNEHFATGGEDCLYCPICRGVHFVRSTSPEVKAHLLTAASSLLQAAAGLMATQVPGDRRTPSVEHINLDTEEGGGWDDDEDAGEWPADEPPAPPSPPSPPAPPAPPAPPSPPAPPAPPSAPPSGPPATPPAGPFSDTNGSDPR